MTEAKKQSEQTYKKINSRLYQEQRGAGRPFSWAKSSRTLFAGLFDIEIYLTSRFEKKEMPVSSEVENSDDAEKRIKEREGQFGTKGRTVSVARVLTAKAKFESKRIINVFENGKITRTEYNTADFSCAEGDGVGGIMYVAGEMLKYDLYHSTPYLSIETYLPADIFHKVAQQIETGKAKKVRVNLECDVFQSEVERSRAEPWMRQEYAIDEESLNYCRLGSIAVGGTKYNPLPRESVEGDG